MQDIVGARFHCAICDAVDICSNCESAGLPGNLHESDGGHSSSHIMIKVPLHAIRNYGALTPLRRSLIRLAPQSCNLLVRWRKVFGADVTRQRASACARDVIRSPPRTTAPSLASALATTATRRLTMRPWPLRQMTMVSDVMGVAG